MDTGLVTLPGFLKPAAVAKAVEESREQALVAFESVQRHNAFLLPGSDDKFSEDHIRNRLLTTQVASVAYDELPADGVLRSLYNAPQLLELVSGVVVGTGAESGSAGTNGLNRLCRLADPLGACSINVFRPGRFHDWHFDESEFTTTLCLQPAPAGRGGHFLYTEPMDQRDGIDAEGNIVDCEKAEQLFECVANVVDRGYEAVAGGKRKKPGTEFREHGKEEDICVHEMEFPAGTLALFAGNRSLHCVTPVDCASRSGAGVTPVPCVDPASFAIATAAAIERAAATDNNPLLKDGATKCTFDIDEARLVAVLCFSKQPGIRNSPEVQKLFWGRVVQ